MKIARSLALVAGITLAAGVGADASSIDPLGPYFNLDTCALIDVTPEADQCYGSVGDGNTNAQSVNVNDGKFYAGDDDTSAYTFGLFGYRDWVELAGVSSFPGDQKDGSFGVGDFSMYGEVAVMLKAGNSWAAYLHDGGLGPVTYQFDIDDALGSGLSNYRIIGRDMTPIPLPAAGWLLLAGLGGLAAYGRKKRWA